MFCPADQGVAGRFCVSKSMIAVQDRSIPMCLKRFGNSKQGCLGKPVSDAQWDKIIAVFEDCLADEIVQTIDDRYGWIDLILRRLGRRPYLLGAGAGPTMIQHCSSNCWATGRSGG